MAKEEPKKKVKKGAEQAQENLDNFIQEKIREGVPENLPSSKIAKAETAVPAENKNAYMTFTGQYVEKTSTYVGVDSDPTYTWM
jgi:hypothetical protein